MRYYLDHNATTPLRPEAARAMQALMHGAHNASSIHREGRAARALIEEARRTIAHHSGALAREIIFTASGTEAINLAFRLTAPIERVIISATEHDAVGKAAEQCALEVQILPVLPSGLVDAATLTKLLEDTRPALVAIMLANNETGVVQDIKSLADLIHAHGSYILCDAVQALGKMPLDFHALGVDMMSLSAHKIGGPAGSGALCARTGVDVAPLIWGGGQELRKRAGTENIMGIVGFAAALDAFMLAAELGVWRDGFETKLKAAFPDMLVFGAEAPRLSTTSCFAVAGLKAESLLMALDLAGFAVSAGAACSSGKQAESHVLTAMGVDKPYRDAAIRVSLGWTTQAADIDAFTDAFITIATKQKQLAA